MTEYTLITGGAGFIGCNYAHRLLGRREPVMVLDSLIRPGSRHNLEWLYRNHMGPMLRVCHTDVRDAGGIAAAVAGARAVVHLAGQTAVTTSVADPRGDFEHNALGTLNVLEAARLAPHRPPVIYASTNKVYGALAAVPVAEHPTRAAFRDLPHGIPEEWPLDFHSPYGCSKGAGDQYTRDYARIFGLPAVVIRQSCIFGPRQMGLEDQGWVAWLVIAAVTGRPITIYGDGHQVRDLLWIDDLLDLYDGILARPENAAGRVYNAGGGPDRTLAVWAELGPMLEQRLSRRLAVTHAQARPGDQRVYVSDIRRAGSELGWTPRVGVEEGLDRLLEWVQAHRELWP